MEDKIKDILDSLGLDLTNPETRRGAIEAISAILDSRKPVPSGGGGGGGGGSEQEIQIDPDLILPSTKHQPDTGDDDSEVEDEENLLSQIKTNDSDPPNASGDSSGSKETGDTSDSNSDSLNDTKSLDGSEKPDDTDSSSDNSDDSSEYNDTDLEDSSEDSSEDSTEGSSEDSSEEDSLEDSSQEGSSEDASDDDLGSNSVDGDSEFGETEDSDESNSDFDEDDIVDDELKKALSDGEDNKKLNSRKIKRERTLAAAKQALDKARAKNASQALIRELESAIAALEALTEAVTKNINDISDDEFNRLVNRVFDAIDALGDSDLTYKSDAERQAQVQEIKTDLADARTQAELSAEDIAQIRAERQATKAREKEADKYKPRTRDSFKGFQDFLISLRRAIALQVSVDETRDDTWSAINRRYGGTGVLKQGQRLNDLPSKQIPIIDFYFDCSGSWTDQDLEFGNKAVEAIAKLEEDGQIKINIYYFANNVHSDVQSARREGGTYAWNEIVKNVITTKATNVIIMTDSDMERAGVSNGALSYIVPGYVWYLWKDGSNAPRLPRDLKGRGGTQQFSFSTN